MTLEPRAVSETQVVRFEFGATTLKTSVGSKKQLSVPSEFVRATRWRPTG